MTMTANPTKRPTAKTTPRARVKIPEGTRDALERAFTFIVAEADEERFPGTQEIAAFAELSLFYFHRLFRAWHGVTPGKLVSGGQIALAKRLLVRGESMFDVAHRAGFAHQSHFCLRFKQLVGQTPGEWLREQGARERTA